MGSSYYVEENYPPGCHVDTKTEDEIFDEIVGDIFEGVEETGVRAGLVGEVGCSWPLTANETQGAASLGAGAAGDRRAPDDPSRSALERPVRDHRCPA